MLTPGILGPNFITLLLQGKAKQKLSIFFFPKSVNTFANEHIISVSISELVYMPLLCYKFPSCLTITDCEPTEHIFPILVTWTTWSLLRKENVYN